MTQESRTGSARARRNLPVMVAIGALALLVLSIHLASRRDGARKASPALDEPSARPAPPAYVSAGEFSETFDGSLNPSRWILTSEADFEERTIDVVNSRLRLRCATRGTRDDSVKFLGVRSVPLFRFGKETKISAELDWNNQANGSYLSAGIVLAPTRTEGNPLATQDFLRVEYIGVPPGKNGRIVVVTRNAGREQYLFTEGWPEVNRQGRKITLQHVEIVFKKSGAFQVWENGKAIFESKEQAIGFDTAYLYLQMSSHSNYPPREVFFDNIAITGLH